MTTAQPPTRGAILEAVVREAAADVEATAAAARADEPDGVHQHRVRVRRLRSVLAGFRESLDAAAAERLRTVYGEWGGVLGVVRDTEVRAEVAQDAIERAGVDDPRVVRRLVDDEREAYAREHTRLVALWHEPRAAERERMLRAFVADPGIRDSDADAAPLVAAVLRREARRVARAAQRLDGSADGFHELRKAARRLRYVAEAVAEAAPDLHPAEVAALAEAGNGLHDALGEHRDGLLFVDRVTRTGVLAARAGEPSEAYGRIAADARRAAQERLEEIPGALATIRAARAALPRRGR